MAGRRKITRKELKEPDEFLTFADRALRYIANNRNRFIAIVGVLALVVVSSVGAMYYFSWQKANAATALERALVKLRASPDEGSELDKAGEMLADVATEYSGYKSADYANYYLGNLFYKRKEYNKAVEHYRKTLKRAGESREALYEMARMGIGYSYEASGDCAQAIDFFKKITAADGTLLKDQAYISLARCYEATGSYQEAHDAYKYVVDNYPNSTSAVDLKDKIARLKEKLKSK